MGKTTAAAVGVLAEEVEEATERVAVTAATVGIATPTIAVVERVERVVVAAATVRVAAPSTAVEEAAETEAAATRQGLGQVVEHPDAVQAVVVVDLTGGMAAVVRGVVKVDAGMVQEAVPKRAHQAPPARTWVRAPTRARSRWWRGKGKRLLP